MDSLKASDINQKKLLKTVESMDNLRILLPELKDNILLQL
jgi:hypothetical protein